ncbi:MAG: sigma-70 family RNA polymerase sigma factor [Ruminococcus sp.]|uniref:RNA polymerase sigma factor n=1 Tax=Ruminococcus sp. TaxID=41978 RepID=UPI0026005A5C|nr:sigma-70 family RNA polymerase sigma factor [Ruminococcus sp.]MCR5601026.1 sigma-70 family RNA polymerase sigma factor [Ruminococcus sp.]
MSEDLKDQYEKIFRYCFFKVHDRSAAEDLTQETFLRFLESSNYKDMNKKLRYLYTIAGNLCADHFRKKTSDELTENIPDDNDYEDCILTNVALGNAIKALSQDDRELVVLRYINDVPVGVLAEIYGISRFKMGRRIKRILDELKKSFIG